MPLTFKLSLRIQVPVLSNFVTVVLVRPNTSVLLLILLLLFFDLFSGLAVFLVDLGSTESASHTGIEVIPQLLSDLP